MSSPDDVIIKKITVACDFNGQSSPTVLMVGNPQKEHHPVQFQVKWLSDKGGSISPDIMDSLTKLYDLAEKNHVCFPELCEYAITSANEDNEDSEDKESSAMLSQDENEENTTDGSENEEEEEEMGNEDNGSNEVESALEIPVTPPSEEPSLPEEAPSTTPPTEMPSSQPLEIPVTVPTEQPKE